MITGGDWFWRAASFRLLEFAVLFSLALLVPWQVAWLWELFFVFIFVALFLSLASLSVAYLFSRPAGGFFDSWLFWPTCLLWLLMLASSVTGFSWRLSLAGTSLASESLLVWSALLAGFAVAYDYFQSSRALVFGRMLAWGWCWLAALSLALAADAWLGAGFLTGRLSAWGFAEIGLGLAAPVAALTLSALVSRAWSWLGRDRYLAWLAGLLALAVLVLANSRSAWLALLAGVLAALNIYFFTLRQDQAAKLSHKRVAVLAVLLLVASAWLLFAPVVGRVRAEVPGLALVAPEARRTALECLAGREALGQGLGSFSYCYSLHRPASANNDLFWQNRFDYSAIWPWQALAGLGWLGSAWLLLWLASMPVAVYLAWRFGKVDNLKSWPVLLTAGVILALSAFSWPVFLASLVALSAVLPALPLGRERLLKWRLAAAGLLIVACLLALWPTMSGPLADYLAVRRTEAGLRLAARLDSDNPLRQTALAELYLVRLTEAEAEDGRVDQVAAVRVAEAVAAAAAAKPVTVGECEAVAASYRTLSAYYKDASIFAIDWLSRAEELEPSNPVLPTERAKLSYRLSDYAGARQALVRALELKSDYYDAAFYLAKLNIQEDRLDEAKQSLLDLAEIAPSADLYYELGRISFGASEWPEAELYFKAALRIEPGHAFAIEGLRRTNDELGRVEIDIR
jgi:tetratricopeptide (TPR) repeat protein